MLNLLKYYDYLPSRVLSNIYWERDVISIYLILILSREPIEWTLDNLFSGPYGKGECIMTSQ